MQAKLHPQLTKYEARYVFAVFHFSKLLSCFAAPYTSSLFFILPRILLASFISLRLRLLYTTLTSPFSPSFHHPVSSYFLCFLFPCSLNITFDTFLSFSHTLLSPEYPLILLSLFFSTFYTFENDLRIPNVSWKKDLFKPGPRHNSYQF